MGRGAWRATVHRVIKSQTQLSDQHLYSCNRRHGPGSRVLNCKVKWSVELPFVATGGQQSPGTQTRGEPKAPKGKNILLRSKGRFRGREPGLSRGQEGGREGGSRHTEEVTSPSLEGAGNEWFPAQAPPP